MKYHCSWCDYIYDELKWDNEEGIEPFTYFDLLPNDFFCPFCDTYKDDFVILPEYINSPLDIDKLTNFEAEHFPTFEIIWDTLKYEIWQIDHPMLEDHFIYKVSLHDVSGDMIEEKKFNIWTDPTGWFDIEYLDIFEIRTYCSRDWIFSTWLINR